MVQKERRMCNCDQRVHKQFEKRFIPNTTRPHDLTQNRLGDCFRGQRRGFVPSNEDAIWSGTELASPLECGAQTRPQCPHVRGLCPAWTRPAVWEAAPCARRALTVLKDPLHVQAVRGTRLVVCAPLQVAGELPRPGVVDDPRVGGTDGVWNRQMHRRHGDHTWLQFLPQPKITE